MGYQAFDQYASEYDAWFLENTNVLETELRLVAACLKDAGSILSIGCGSALFEMKSKWVHVEIAADFEKQKAGSKH